MNIILNTNLNDSKFDLINGKQRSDDLNDGNSGNIGGGNSSSSDLNNNNNNDGSDGASDDDSLSADAI